MRERETLRKDTEPLELSPCPVDLLDQEFSFYHFLGKFVQSFTSNKPIYQSTVVSTKKKKKHTVRERERERRCCKIYDSHALAPKKRRKNSIYLFRHKNLWILQIFGKCSADHKAFL
jgi:hypothetical protein